MVPCSGHSSNGDGLSDTRDCGILLDLWIRSGGGSERTSHTAGEGGAELECQPALYPKSCCFAAAKSGVRC